MTFITIYANAIRAIFIILSLYYIFRHDFKKLKASIIVFILTFVPALLNKLFALRADIAGNILYFTIIVMSLYLGSELKFYDKYSWWDRMLHFLCGVMFVSFGIPLAEKTGITSNTGILFFCLTFSTTLHVIWEIAEYAVDAVSRTDHQRWQKHSQSNNHLSPNAVQPAGLVDTMNDIIICMAGTIAACVVWWFIL